MTKETAALKKKGGAVYPRISLEDAVSYARKLVSKTHTAPQSYTTIFPGVFGVAPTNTIGQIRASALKQYGLLEGKPEAYSASELAKKIAVCPPDELHNLCRQACLKPKIFRVLFDTFQSDSVSAAKIRQQSASAGVHPDQAENCAKLFVESVTYSGLATLSGDVIQISASGGASPIDKPDDASDTEPNLEVDTDVKSNENHTEFEERDPPAAAARSVIQVNVTIDSSLDTDKLERQLALLRKYGAL